MMTFVSKVQSQGLIILGWYLPVYEEVTCPSRKLPSGETPFLERDQQIGGPGKIVQIDESKFGKRKCHRGHRVEGQWVFGGIEEGLGVVLWQL